MLVKYQLPRSGPPPKNLNFPITSDVQTEKSQGGKMWYITSRIAADSEIAHLVLIR